MLNAGQTRDCLDLTILNDNQFENTEDLSGFLQSFILDGIPINTLPRVTFQPQRTEIFIIDDDGNSAMVCILVPIA